MGFMQKSEFMDKKLWFLKIFALGVSLGIVIWAIEVLRHRDVQSVNAPALTGDSSDQSIPAKVQVGPRPKQDR